MFNKNMTDINAKELGKKSWKKRKKGKTKKEISEIMRNVRKGKSPK